jgi:hypothetical protein
MSLLMRRMMLSGGWTNCAWYKNGCQHLLGHQQPTC